MNMNVDYNIRYICHFTAKVTKKKGKKLRLT